MRIKFFGGSLAEIGSNIRTIPQRNFKLSLLFEMFSNNDTISKSNNGLNETYEITIELSKISIDLFFNLLLKEESLKQLDYNTIFITSCILAVVEGLIIDPASISIGYTNIYIDNLYNSTTNIGLAVTALSNALGIIYIFIYCLMKI